MDYIVVITHQAIQVNDIKVQDARRIGVRPGAPGGVFNGLQRSEQACGFRRAFQQRGAEPITPWKQEEVIGVR